MRLNKESGSAVHETHPQSGAMYLQADPLQFLGALALRIGGGLVGRMEKLVRRLKVPDMCTFVTISSLFF